MMTVHHRMNAGEAKTPGGAEAMRAGSIGLGQLIRFGWFYANYRLAARRVRAFELPEGLADRMPGRDALVRALFALMREDRANVRAGLYPLPDDALPTPLQWLAQARVFFADLPQVDARRHARGGGRDLERRSDAASRAALPAYYTQNFHFQTDGYLSAESAALYDYQVDVLFSGGADAMRRLCLAPLVERLAHQGERAPLLLDLACGTGRTGGFLKQRWPGSRLAAVDLSQPYLGAAQAHLAGVGRAHPVRADGEALPFADGSFDAAVCVFAFHELPSAVRSRFADEIARVLKPGGRFVLVDSLQPGDVPELDAVLEFFPHAYYEPFFGSFLQTDFDALFTAAGLIPAGQHAGFLAKRCVYDRGP